MVRNELLHTSFGVISSIGVEWTKATLAQRRSHAERLLEGLEHRDAEIRFTNARRLFYILQGSSVPRRLGKLLTSKNPCAGTFEETGSPEDQLHWIFDNCRLVRSCNGISSVVEALKIAGRKHDLLRYIGIRLSINRVTEVLPQQLVRPRGPPLPYLYPGQDRLDGRSLDRDFSLSRYVVSYHRSLQRPRRLCR